MLSRLAGATFIILLVRICYRIIRGPASARGDPGLPGKDAAACTLRGRLFPSRLPVLLLQLSLKNSTPQTRLLCWRVYGGSVA